MRVEAPEHRSFEAGTSGEPSVLFNEELLIKEAKRRHRRRLALLAAIVLFVIGVSSAGEVWRRSGTPSTPHRPPPRLHHPPTTSPPTTPTVPVSDPTCKASQLAMGYGEPQGATGMWFSTFSIADTSGQPCALRSGVTVEFFDAEGNDRIASTQVPAEVALSANASLPPPGQAAPPHEQLAALMMGWPTIPNAIMQLTGGGGGGECPEPLFSPQSAQITFAGLQPITVQPLPRGGEAPIPSNESICGASVRIELVRPLTSQGLS